MLEDGLWLPEGGTAAGADRRSRKKKCCKNEKKFKPLKRNVRMYYHQFDKIRRCLRFKKIFKNIVIGTMVYITAYLLIKILIWDYWS